MDESILIFRGRVRDGSGRFAVELGVPGAGEIPAGIEIPPDWPQRMEPGSLNVRIEPEGWPSLFLERAGGKTVKFLDSGEFDPVAEFPADAIEGNTLPPTYDQPRRGTSQVWRALLINETSGELCPCFVLRRIGSTISQDLELVAREKLRDRLKLENGTPVSVHMEGAWR